MRDFSRREIFIIFLKLFPNGFLCRAYYPLPAWHQPPARKLFDQLYGRLHPQILCSLQLAKWRIGQVSLMSFVCAHPWDSFCAHIGSSFSVNYKQKSICEYYMYELNQRTPRQLFYFRATLKEAFSAYKILMRFLFFYLCRPTHTSSQFQHAENAVIVPREIVPTRCRASANGTWSARFTSGT